VTVKFLCARQFQNKIEESVYTLLVATIERYGLRDQFRILDNKIIHRRTGRSSSSTACGAHQRDQVARRRIDICWLEEAHALVEAQWQILEPTLRKEGSQFWLIFNPMLSSDFVWKRFVLNPAARHDQAADQLHRKPVLVDTMLEVIDTRRAEDEDDYRARLPRTCRG
jgi:phage terminase large subunit